MFISDRYIVYYYKTTLTLVVDEALDGAVPLYFRLGEIIVDVGLWIALLNVVARDRQGGPRGGVFGQAEVRRLLVDRVVRRDRLPGRVLVTIAADLTGTGRLVPAELAAERDREMSPGGSILPLPLGITLGFVDARRGGIGGSTPTRPRTFRHLYLAPTYN